MELWVQHQLKKNITLLLVNYSSVKLLALSAPTLIS